MDNDCHGGPDPKSEIGGYFGLELPDYGDPFADDAKFQSARAALRAVLEACKARRVRMPAYICSSMVKSASDAQVEVETYELDDNLYPKDIEAAWRDHEYFLYVNYFGLAEANIRRLLQDVPPERLIIDNSQALFSNFEQALASVYSPRKFAGLPDGGLVRAARVTIAPPDVEDRGSADRMRYLVMRAAFSAREGYAEFNAARRSLTENAPLRMSRLTRRLTRAIPWSDVKKARRDNYRRMHDWLGGQNNFPLASPADDVAPLCYPFWRRGEDLTNVRRRLAGEDIFVPVYWEDALPRLDGDSIERALVREALFLPIDQRMNVDEVEFVVERVSRLMKFAG